MNVIFDFDQGLTDLVAVNSDLEQKSAAERIRWADHHFGDRLILSTSFGVQSAVMLHLVTEEIPGIPVVFIDTGYLFPETYQFAEQLQERLNLNLKVYQPAMTAARQEALYGKLWEQGREGLEKYGRMNKAEPMNRAVKELGAVAWLTGLRRSQSKSRADLSVVNVQNRTTKIHPILEWSEKEIYYYLKTHDLPFHPLWEKGYVSVGDWHSTRPLTAGMKEEDTRFGGVKRECGLHELSGQGDWQI